MAVNMATAVDINAARIMAKSRLFTYKLKVSEFPNDPVYRQYVTEQEAIIASLEARLAALKQSPTAETAASVPQQSN